MLKNFIKINGIVRYRNRQRETIEKKRSKWRMNGGAGAKEISVTKC